MKQITSPLRAMQDLVRTEDSRAPHANVTNASHLMGDVAAEDDFGDIDDFGDADDFNPQGDADYGDADYGDIDSSPLAAYDTLIGDPGKKNLWQRIPKGVKLAGALAAGAGGAYLTGRGIQRLLANRAKKRAMTGAKMTRSRRQQTIQTQLNRRRSLGMISHKAAFPFYQVMGATLNSAQISPTEAFPADVLKYILDEQNIKTPFEVEVAGGVYSLGTFTATAVGVATARTYAVVIVTVGINTLNGNPGTIFNITGSLPTANGPLTISTPFSFTMLKGFDAKFLVFPWQLVTNKPLPVAGSYSNANPIVINVTGLPSTAVVNLIVPGSLHTWTIGMRNSLIRK